MNKEFIIIDPRPLEAFKDKTFSDYKKLDGITGSTRKVFFSEKKRDNSARSVKSSSLCVRTIMLSCTSDRSFRANACQARPVYPAMKIF